MSSTVTSPARDLGAIAFWNIPEIEGSLVHIPKLPDPDDPCKLLLVFVHGFLGSPAGTWGNMPAWLVEDQPLEPAILAFSYATAPRLRADIRLAASRLRLMLQEQFDAYRHIVFLTHSTGGLVVKELLRQDGRSAWSTRHFSTKKAGPPQRTSSKAIYTLGAPHFARIPQITCKTRQVFNFAVPHNGAAVWPTIGLFVQYAYNLARCPYARVRSLVSSRARGEGHNRILRQLMYRNRWVLRLDKDYNQLLLALERIGHPRPAMTEVLADDDPVIAASSDVTSLQFDEGEIRVMSDAERLVARGTHTSIKLPENPNDLIISYLRNRLAIYMNRPRVLISYLSVQRVMDIDGQEDLFELVREAGDETEGERTDGQITSWSGTQRFARRRLLTLATEPGARAKRIVLTGDAGVGKSVVLRRVACQLATRVLMGRDASDPLPVVMPLQQLTLNEEEVARFIGSDTIPARPWDVLRRYWVGWLEELTENLVASENAGDAAGDHNDGRRDRPDGSSCVVSEAWLDGQVRDRPTVLVLDSVDEFLANHPSIELGHFHKLLTDLETAAASHRPLTILLGIRKSLPGLAHLCGTEDLLEVLPLTPKQAESAFPGAMTLLDRIDDPQTRKLLLTPLVLVHLGPRLEELAAKSLRTRSELLLAAVEAVIVRSGLVSSTFAEPGGHVADWVDALCIVAWQFFAEYRGHQTVSKLLDEVRLVREAWTNRADVSPDHRPAESLLAALELLRDQPTLVRLLRRTLFVPIGKEDYRFRHREWEDFLAARYVAHCMRSRDWDELSKRSLNKEIYITASEQLDADTTSVLIDRSDLESIQAYSAGDERNYLLMNVLATIGNGCVGVTGTGLKFIRELILDPGFPEIARLVTISSFDVRMLRNDPRDDCLPNLRGQIVPALLQILDEGADEGWNAITVSMAWCCLKALASVLCDDDLKPSKPWPGLGDKAEHRNDALAVTTVMDGGIRTFTTRQQYLQLAFARLPLSAKNRPHEAITIVHYLYPVIVALTKSAAPNEVVPILRAVFNESSGVEDVVTTYSHVPELAEVYRFCKTSFAKLAGPTQRADGR